MDGMKIDAIGGKDQKKKLPEIRFNNFNNFYTQLKSGKPIIGNLLNGSGTAPSDGSAQASFQG